VKTRTRGSEAEVDGAIYPSTVTNSGPCIKSTGKHSIYPHTPRGYAKAFFAPAPRPHAPADFAAGEGQPPAEACGWEGGAKTPFELPIRPFELPIRPVATDMSSASPLSRSKARSISLASSRTLPGQ
jgi:hypothetical protein